MSTNVHKDSEITNQQDKNRNIILYPIPFGEKRLEFPVSIVQGSTKPKIIKRTTFKAVRDFLQTSNEDAINQADSLAADYLQDKAKYQLQKDKLHGFIVGNFAYRDDDSCLTYVPCLVFDFDGYHETFEAELTLSDLKKDEYVFGAWLSPSRHGLRVLVWANSTPETHKKMYKSLVNHFCTSLNLPAGSSLKKAHVDTNTQNISRHFYYVATTSVYLNLESKVYEPETVTQQEPPKNNRDLKENKSLSLDYKINHCKRITDKRCGKIEDIDRNNWIYRVACNMNEHYIPGNEILNYCLTYEEPDFTSSEIEKTVNSAISDTTPKYGDQEIINYGRKAGKKEIQVPVTSITAFNDKTPIKVPENIEIRQFDKKERGISKIEIIEDFLTERYDLRYNIIANVVEAQKKGTGSYTEFNKSNIIVDLLRKNINGIQIPLDAFLSSDYIEKYNPISAYFDSLPGWKPGDPDYILDLAGFIKAKDQYWFNSQFKKTLVRCVACSLGVVPFNKQCFTLFGGDQNQGKTTFLRFLCPPNLKDYYKENIELGNKDGRIALAQNFIINIDELAVFSKQDIETAKSLLSEQRIKVRPVYGKQDAYFNRIANFFASTNKREFLTDETGNVRWLIMEIESIIHDGGGANGYNARVNIDLVWAQAYYLLKSNFDFLMSGDEISFSEGNNQEFKKTYPELEILQKHLSPALPSDLDAVFMTTNEIKEYLEDLKVGRKLFLPMITKALTELKFEKRSKRITIRTVGDKEYTEPRKGYFVFKIQV